MVDISQLDELKGNGPLPDGGMRIGALSALAGVFFNPGGRSSYAALARAALASDRPDTRARATIGGNLCQRPRCWYLRADYHCVRAGGDLCFAADGDNRYHAVLGGTGCHMVHPSDVAPALVALGALAGITGPAGVRVAPFAEFFLRSSPTSTSRATTPRPAATVPGAMVNSFASSDRRDRQQANEVN